MMDHRRTRLLRASCGAVLAIVLPVVALAAQPESAVRTARLTDVTVVTERDATRIKIKTSVAAKYEAVLIDKPSRLVIDFDNTSYAWRQTPLTVMTGPLKEIHGGQYRDSVARLVIELTRRVEYAVRDDADGVSVIIPTASLVGTTERRREPVKLGQTSFVPPTDGVPPRDSKDPLDLDRLKRTLTQFQIVSTPPKTSAPAPPSQGVPQPPATGPRETVALTLQDSIALAVQRNLGLRSTSLFSQSAGFEIPKARARFHPSVGFAMTSSGFTTVPVAGITVPAERGTTVTAEAAAVTTQSTQRLTPLATQPLPTGGTLVLSSDFSRVETHPSTPSTQFSSTVALSLVQPLLRGGRIYVATQPIRNAEFDARVADYALKAQTLSVTSGTKTAYYSVLLAEKLIDVTEAAIERDKALVTASQALFQARLVTKRDVFSAEVSLAQDSARLVSNRADLETAKNALADILGLSIATDIVLVDKEIPFEPVRLGLERLIATATAGRPEIMAIQEQLAKSTLNIKVARNALLTQLDFVGSYGRATTRPTFSKSLDLSGDIWSVGLVFSFPLGNVAARATLAQAEIDHSRLQVELEQTKRQIELQVRSAVIKLQKSVEQVKALTIAIEQAKGKLEVGKAQFALGLATNLDITDAQLAILNADTDLLTAIVNYNIGLAELEASIAGPLPLE